MQRDSWLFGKEQLCGGRFFNCSCLILRKEATKSLSLRQPIKLPPLFSSRAERTSNQSNWNVTSRVIKICKHLQSFMCTLSNEHIIIKWFPHLFLVVGVIKWKQGLYCLPEIKEPAESSLCYMRLCYANSCCLQSEFLEHCKALEGTPPLRRDRFWVRFWKKGLHTSSMWSLLECLFPARHTQRFCDPVFFYKTKVTCKTPAFRISKWWGNTTYITIMSHWETEESSSRDLLLGTDLQMH